VVQFDRPHMISYPYSIVAMSVDGTEMMQVTPLSRTLD